MTSLLDISEKGYKIISEKKIPKTDVVISRIRFPKKSIELFPKKVFEISEKKNPKKHFRKRVYFYFRKKNSEKDSENFRKEIPATVKP